MTRKNAVLIATTPDDIHAASITFAIRELGHKSDIWLVGDIPEEASASINFDAPSKSDNACVQHLDGKDPLSNYGTFWFRRSAEPLISNDKIHPSDYAMSENESKQHIRSLLHSCSENLLAVNGYTEAIYAENKPNQLRAAVKVGLKIPKTLVSNDPSDIREFISRHQESGVIYKSYQTPIWQSSHGYALGYTALVTNSDLPRDSLLRMTPGIFQVHVRKKYELRVIWLWGRFISVKIDSQNVPDARMDWRVAQDSRIDLEAVSIPDEIEKKCSALMRELSLRFGCIDMIVTDENEYVFLEVNQMGQFLWIEDINPEIEVFDPFVQFILDPINFKSGYKRYGLSYHEYKEEANRFLVGLQKNRQDYLRAQMGYKE